MSHPRRSGQRVGLRVGIVLVLGALSQRVKLVIAAGAAAVTH